MWNAIEIFAGEHNLTSKEIINAENSFVANTKHVTKVGKFYLLENE